MIAAFDPEYGTPVALLDGEAITAARTAAASALSTDLLARKDAKKLVIIGTGVQARAHLRAVSRVRRFETVAVAARDPDKAEALASEFERESGWPARWHDTIEQGVSAGDVVCACTHSPEPVIRREWLEPGTHVTSVGYNTAGREVDERTVVDSLVVIESRAAALAAPPSGSNDLNWPIRDGKITKEHIHAELGEIVAGTRPGRANATQLTLYKSVGVAVEDAAATALVLKLARERGVGREIEL